MEEHAFPIATDDAESSTSYQPPPDAIMGPAVYPLARQNPQPTYKPDYQFGYPQGKGNTFYGGYGEFHNSQWTLPPAWTESEVMLVLPVDPGLWSDVISRWESITINRLNSQTWSDNKAKLDFVENLLRESEKLMWQQWQTAYPGVYSTLETITDDPQNITSQLAVKSGKLYFLSTTEKLFAKLPPSLSKKIEESFKAKHNGLSAGVLPAIKFTHTFVSEMCKDAALAKELRDLSLCSTIPIPGYYKNNKKKYRIKKSRTYKGKPHNSHVKPFRRKYKDDRGRVKKCKCFISDFDDSSDYSILEGEGDVHQNISIMVQDTPIEEAAFMAIKGINESDDEQSIEEDYYNHHAFIFHPGPPTKIADIVQSAGSWKPDKELPTQSKSCEHDWKENTVTNYTVCYYCGILTTDMSRLNFPKCQLTICALCARNYLGKTVNVKGKQPHKPEEEKDFSSNESHYAEKGGSLLVKDLTDALKIIDQLKIEQIRLEEQKDEEIRKLKTQLQKEKEKETEARYSSEEFPPLGNSHKARPFMEAEVHYSGNTITSLKIRKITNQLYNVKVEFEIPSFPMFGTIAIIDTRASACCINKKVIPEDALEPLTQTVFFNGLNSRQQATHKIKQGSFLIEGNKFKIPLIYAFDMNDNNGIEMLIGANFLRSMKG
ncbi:RNA-directed DNA polymerase [Tanacetum coccineum]